MKFEGISYQPTGNEPAELAKFLQHYALVNRFLLRFNETGISVAENLKTFNRIVPIAHGLKMTIAHNLGSAPLSFQANGRIEFIQIISKSSRNVVIKAKLLTVAILETTPGKPQDRIPVSDVTFFKVGDQVTVGKQVRTIMGIDKEKLLLDNNVIYDSTIHTVSLYSEKADIFMM
jgi:hypothetical protein